MLGTRQFLYAVWSATVATAACHPALVPRREEVEGGSDHGNEIRGSLEPLPDSMEAKQLAKNCSLCDSQLMNTWGLSRNPEALAEYMRRFEAICFTGDAGIECGNCTGHELCVADVLNEAVKKPTDDYLATRANELLDRILACYQGSYTRQAYLDAESKILPDANPSLIVYYRRRVEAAKCK